MKDTELIQLSREAQKFAYAPYSKVTVGAAVLCVSGKVYSGCNIENASYGATVCAERTAIFKAISEGESQFKAIAVSSNLEEFIYPCGICRQVLSEFSSDIRIIITNCKQSVKILTIAELLPHAFELEKE